MGGPTRPQALRAGGKGKALPTLKFESRFARRLGQSADAPVVEVAVAIEDDLGDALVLAEAGDELPDLLGGADLVVLFELALEVLREGRGGREGLARRVVDDLRVDVPRGAEHAEARALGGALHLLANAELAALPA